MTDEEQLIFANEEKVTVFTHDVDFSELRLSGSMKGKDIRGSFIAIKKVIRLVNVSED